MSCSADSGGGRRSWGLLFRALLVFGHVHSGRSQDGDNQLFEYKALKVNPNLSNDLTEAMRDKFRKLTKLEQVEMDGDLELQGEITGYEVRAAAVTANEVAAQNRLTVTVKLKFTNRKYPEDDFEKDFSAYSDYDSTNALDAVESTLCQEIIDKLVEDMFNASVAQW